MEENHKPAGVVVVDMEMPFLSMVVFMIKLAFAAIPAGFIIAFGYTMIIGILAAAFGHK